MVIRRIAVVGGGISGIAAALELSKCKQIEVCLFESANRLGGVLQTINTGQYLIECSADNFSTLIPNALELSREFGLHSELIHPNEEGRRAFVYLNGKIHAIPAGFSLMQPTQWLSIIRTSTLSWPGKLRLLAEYWVRPKSSKLSESLNNHELALDSTASDNSDDESLESFAVRRLGREAFERLVEPIVSGIFTANPKTLSMAATMPQFLQMEQKFGGLIRGYLASRKRDTIGAARRASGARYDSFVAPRYGMRDWIERLSKNLPTGCVRLGTLVTALNRPCGMNGSHEWQLQIQSDDSAETGRTKTERFDGVILATPASTTAKLIRQVSVEASSLVSSIPYASSAVVAMILNRADFAGRLDGFGIVVPRCERRNSLAISFTSNKYPGRVPDDQILLRVFLGGALNPQLVDRDDEQLYQLANREVRQILKWRGSHPNWQAVIRWKESMPQYLVGHVQKIRDLDTALEKFRTLRLCGAAYQGVGIPQCVRSGQIAAQQLVRSLGVA